MQQWVRNSFSEAQHATRKELGLNNIIDSNGNHNISLHAARNNSLVKRTKPTPTFVKIICIEMLLGKFYRYFMET